MTKRFTISLIEYKGNIYAFEKIENTNDASEISWKNLLIKGENSWFLQDKNSWKLALQEVSDQLNFSTKLAEGWVYWFLEETHQEAMQLLQQLHNDFDIGQWSVLHWQGLENLGLVIEQEPHQALEQWLITQLSHLLTSKPLESMQLECGDPQESSNETDLITLLTQENQQLKSENEKLLQLLEAQKKQSNYLKDRLENSVILKMDMETLISYLPAIYKNFWGQIRPDELAMLAGSLQIPEIPSPVREPDQSVLQVLKKRLQSMPREQQEQLRQFCYQLPHSPKPRPEMAFFFETNQ